MNLSQKLGEMTYDGLITDVNPKTRVAGATIRKGSASVTYTRGTIFAKSSTDNKLVILGSTAADSETLEPYAILTDDVTVGTSADVVATFYVAGCFNLSKCTVKTNYTITEANKDALRKYDIVFKSASGTV